MPYFSRLPMTLEGPKGLRRGQNILAGLFLKGTSTKQVLRYRQAPKDNWPTNSILQTQVASCMLSCVLSRLILRFSSPAAHCSLHVSFLKYPASPQANGSLSLGDEAG